MPIPTSIMAIIDHRTGLGEQRRDGGQGRPARDDGAEHVRILGPVVRGRRRRASFIVRDWPRRAAPGRGRHQDGAHDRGPPWPLRPATADARGRDEELHDVPAMSRSAHRDHVTPAAAVPGPNSREQRRDVAARPVVGSSVDPPHRPFSPVDPSGRRPLGPVEPGPRGLPVHSASGWRRTPSVSLASLVGASRSGLTHDSLAGSLIHAAPGSSRRWRAGHRYQPRSAGLSPRGYQGSRASRSDTGWVPLQELWR